MSWAWAAGLFEGEGCVTINRTRRKYLMLAISMHARDRDVIERFAEIVGCGYVNGPHKNGMIRWAVIGKAAMGLVDVEDFVSQLGARRQARIRECLAEIADQPLPMSNHESGKLAGKASGEARRLKAAA